MPASYMGGEPASSSTDVHLSPHSDTASARGPGRTPPPPPQQQHHAVPHDPHHSGPYLYAPPPLSPPDLGTGNQASPAQPYEQNAPYPGFLLPHTGYGVSYMSVLPGPIQSPGQGGSVGIAYTDDAGQKPTDFLRRRCANCSAIETSTWRKSTLAPGKIVCNKCGLFERTHSRARPARTSQIRAPPVGASASHAAGPDVAPPRPDVPLPGPVRLSKTSHAQTFHPYSTSRQMDSSAPQQQSQHPALGSSAPHHVSVSASHLPTPSPSSARPETPPSTGLQGIEW